MSDKLAWILVLSPYPPSSVQLGKCLGMEEIILCAITWPPPPQHAQLLRNPTVWKRIKQTTGLIVTKFVGLQKDWLQVSLEYLVFLMGVKCDSVKTIVNRIFRSLSLLKVVSTCARAKVQPSKAWFMWKQADVGLGGTRTAHLRESQGRRHPCARTAWEASWSLLSVCPWPTLLHRPI